MPTEDLHFPQNFLWGASTSSHQVEGNNVNDWSAWETSERRLEDLQKNGQLEKYGLDNFVSGKAAEHLKHYQKDFAIAKDMGHNATRLSLEWSRIEPGEGKFSEEALSKYREIITHLRELGIEPLVTLWHWTNPLWLRDKGGWHHAQVAHYFKRYTEHVAKALSDVVKFWITLNEPMVFSSQSYLTGNWPPQKKNPFIYYRVINNLAYAHQVAYTTIKRINPKAEVGIAKNNIYFEAYGDHPFNKLLKKPMHWWWNDHFLQKIKNHQDFIGVNYYFHNRVDFRLTKAENKRLSDLGWELHPEGIYHVLKDLEKYHKPIYITENGLADATDQQREWFIVNILKFIHQAMHEGADVRGYLHWSLMDNFEWADGYHPRFGLVEVNYQTQERTPRPSSQAYSKIIKNNQLTKDLLDKHSR